MARWLALAGVLVVLDQLSKLAVLRWLAPGRTVEVTPFFNFVLVYNPGAAFSFLAQAPGWQRGFFIAIALVASAWIVFMLRRHWRETLFSFALALILGGAVGNLIDRVVYGAVVDFLDFHAAGWHWPAFNVADSAISVGAVLLVWDGFFGRRPAPGA
jgi:signal peptidase II